MTQNYADGTAFRDDRIQCQEANQPSGPGLLHAELVLSNAFGQIALRARNLSGSLAPWLLGVECDASGRAAAEQTLILLIRVYLI